MKEPARNSDPASLHPVFRDKARQLLERLAAEQIPFRLFEGYRSPQRQQFLWEQGRSRPGLIVTKARPWTSFHQYGLAGDFVLFEKGKWSWDARHGKDLYWKRLHEIGRALGLEPLAWELPHLQVAGLRIEDRRAGRYPEGIAPPEAPVKEAA